MHSLKITLDDGTLAALAEASAQEYRPVAMQAIVLLRRALNLESERAKILPMRRPGRGGA